MTTIVRFAPSPTGHLHIGGLRTALFNELFARHSGGKLLLRIEDTDRERSTDAYTQSILDAFEWTGIIFDGAPVIQSERIGRHQEIIAMLLASKKAYRCYCSSEEVVDRNKKTVETEILHAVKYDRHCLDNNEYQEGKPCAIRFKLPFTSGPITFIDLIRGEVTIDAEQLDDFIIARSDGGPMYNFVVVVDDHDMHISHIIRGEDHISNTPKQILLYQACGFSVPQFAHIPMILGSTGQRLSKRDGAVSVLEYRQKGYLAHALINYLVRLGWAHGDQEKFSKQEMVQCFALHDVSRHGARFDQDKLDWLNGVYMREMSGDVLLSLIVRDVEPELESKTLQFSMQQRIKLIDLCKDRAKTLGDVVAMVIGFHQAPTQFNTHDREQWLRPEVIEYIPQLIKIIDSIDKFDVELVSHAVKAYAHQSNTKLVTVAQLIRIALWGSSVGPGVFELAAVLGKQETMKRLNALYISAKNE
jgi:glutamyl-tRNA synthetase